MDYARVEKFILDMLKKKLSDKLYYHNVLHTRETIKAVEDFSRAEGLPEEEITILKTAALFHDSGYLRMPVDNERIGTEIAREILPEYDYTPEQIEKICRLILATRMPQKPENLEEQIICDADLQYLGTEEYDERSKLLRKEMSLYNIVFTDHDWHNFQINFLKNHHYFTQSCRQSRDTVKAGYLKKLIGKREDSSREQ
ncbi:MAG: HD domain-containing protein [Victivallaceae bacterium]|jgi:predicted metal-dependent HD superfamily phosphohydrolase